MSNVIRKLQQRIDKRSNDITELEQYLKNPDEAWLAGLRWCREEQTLDKRLMGELVNAIRLIKTLEATVEFNELINWRN